MSRLTKSEFYYITYFPFVYSYERCIIFQLKYPCFSGNIYFFRQIVSWYLRLVDDWGNF